MTECIYNDAMGVFANDRLMTAESTPRQIDDQNCTLSAGASGGWMDGTQATIPEDENEKNGGLHNPPRMISGKLSQLHHLRPRERHFPFSEIWKFWPNVYPPPWRGPKRPKSIDFPEGVDLAIPKVEGCSSQLRSISSQINSQIQCSNPFLEGFLYYGFDSVCSRVNN